MKTIYEYLECEMQKAIPENWELLPDGKLLGKDNYKIKYAFNSNSITGENKLIHILVLDLAMELNEDLEKKIIELRDNIISTNDILFVIVEQEKSNLLDDIGVFESEILQVSHRNYFKTYCCKENDYKTSIDGIDYEDLNQVIHYVWDGTLTYEGISSGKQLVNLEIMQDTCWKCNCNMKTVTGIVFPDIELESWNNDLWQYYLRLFPLSQITSENAETIKAFVDKLRINDRSITKVEYRYSNSVGSEYFAASCPECDSIRGDLYVIDDRMQYLHDLDSRTNGQLCYHSLELNITKDIIKELTNGFEGFPHSCYMGWC